MARFVVECGNGRVIALMIAAWDYPANAELYKLAVKEAAAGFGLEIPSGMELPVLVRERMTTLTESERKAFAEECNASTTIQASAVEKARTDAPHISLEMLNSLDIGDSESISQALQSSHNKPFVSSFLSKLPQEEQAQLVDKAGVISAEGIRRIVLAMFVRAFPGEVGLQLAERFFEQTEGDILNIANGIVRALGSLAKSEAMTAKGERYQSLSIGPDLAKTVSVMAAIARTPGMDVVTYIAQGQLGERELTPFQERILVDLYSLRRSGKRVSDVLKLYAEKVIASPPPSQAGMFGGVEPSREAYWRAAMNEVRAIEEAEKAQRARKRQAGQLVETGSLSCPGLACLAQSYTYLVKKLDKCNLDAAEAEKALGYGTLREIIEYGIGTKAKTQLCRAGFMKGTYQLRLRYPSDIAERVAPFAQKLGILTKKRGIARIYSPHAGEFVYDVTLPETTCTVEELLGRKQFIPELVVHGEKGQQARMFRANLSCGCAAALLKPGIALTDCERRNGLGGALERCVLKVKEKPGVKNPFAICRAVISKPVCGGKK